MFCLKNFRVNKMKSKLFVGLSIVILLAFSGCEVKVDNSVTFKNLASETVYVNFLGKVITLKSGQSQVIKEIQKGEYAYETAYDVPDGVNGASVEGATSGTMEIKAQTKVYVLYVSHLVGTGSTLTYVLSATISSSDKVSTNSSPTSP